MLSAHRPFGASSRPHPRIAPPSQHGHPQHRRAADRGQQPDQQILGNCSPDVERRSFHRQQRVVTQVGQGGPRPQGQRLGQPPDRLRSPAEGLVSFRWDGTDAKSHLRVVGSPSPGGTPHDDEHQVLPRRVFPFAKAELTLANDGMEPSFPGPPAGLVMMAPRGDYALAQVDNDITTGSTWPALAKLVVERTPVRAMLAVPLAFLYGLMRPQLTAWSRRRFKSSLKAAFISMIVPIVRSSARIGLAVNATG